MTKIIDNQKVFRRFKKPVKLKSGFRSAIERTADRMAALYIYIRQSIQAGPSKTFIAVTASVLGIIVLGASLFAVIPQHSAQHPRITLHEDEQVYNDLLNFLEPFVPSMGSGEYPFDESFVIPLNSSSVYQIREGDTLSDIAHDHNISVSTLVSYNEITNVRRLLPGTPLKIPSIDGISHKVRKGESIHSISDTYSIAVNLILDANDLDTDVLQPGQDLFIPGAEMNPYDLAKAKGELFIWPTRGRFTSGYGYRQDPFTGLRRFHYGIDLANAVGTRVTAAMAGRVVLIENSSTGYGKYIVLKHAYGGYQTLYAHLSKIYVRTNQWVQQGQAIGTMGSTGRSTGPHLHFAVYQNNRPVNPMNLLH